MNEECETAEELTPKVIKPDCNQTKHLSIQKGKIVEQKLKSSQSVVLKVKRGNKTQTLKEKCKEEERVCNDYNEDGRFGVEKHDNGSQRRKNDLVGKLLSVDSLLDEFQETLEVKHAEHGKDSESFKFSIIKKCILCGNLMLADNRGYIYNKGVTRQNETIWWCAFRDDNSICQASALQQGESFQLRPTPHCHEPTSGKKAKWQDEDQCCETAKDDISEPSVSLRKLDSNLSKKDKEMQNSLMRGKITAKEKTKEEKANEAGFLPAAKLGIVEGLFSTHGRPKIVDTKGYSYTMKVNGVYRKVWRCSVRNKSMSCNVHITQKGNLYKYSSNQHCHDPKPLPDPNRKKRKKSSSEKIDWKPEPKIKTENYPDLYPLIESQVLNIVSSSGSVEHAAETVKPLTAIVEPMSSEVLEGLNIRSEVVTILENGSKKGRSLLVDPQGYTYTLRRDRGNKIYWACSVRNSKLHCGACMIQTGEIFSRGKKEHLHAPKPLKLSRRRRQMERTGDYKKRDPVVYVEPDVSFRVLDGSTRHGNSKLFDSDGYVYTVRRIKGDVKYWKCIFRNKRMSCKATVCQKGDKFRVRKEKHCHEPTVRFRQAPESPCSGSGAVTPPGPFSLPGDNVTYQVADRISRNGLTKSVLMDSNGYFYNQKHHTEEYVYWMCPESHKNGRCSASVSQRGENFKFGKRDHTHDPPSIELMTEEAEEGCGNGTSIKVIEAIATCLDLDKEEENHITIEATPHFLCGDVEEMQNFASPANMNSRIKISTEFIPPKFLQKDIFISDGERHLVLALKEQMKLLSEANVWYIDVTSQVVCPPFSQTLTIQTYIHTVNGAKHVPVAFVLMSRCQKLDYEQVFQILLRDLPQSIGLELLMAPVDETIWEALKVVFPKKRIHGCSFYWGMTIWNKVCELDLKPEYIVGSGVYGFINKILALPFLPQDQLPISFQSLWEFAGGHNSLEALLDFIDNTWITGTLWHMSSWNTYMYPPRLRSEVENWYLHTAVVGQKPTFCRFVWHLAKVSRQISFPASPLWGKKLLSFLRSNVGSAQNSMMELFTRYADGNLDADVFLQDVGLMISNEVIEYT